MNINEFEIVLGGTVFTCLKTESHKNTMFQGASRSGDIDIFLIGLNEKEAEKKVQ